MGWDNHNGRRYYYRVRKVKGRVVREYCGSGLDGEIAEREDQERRAEREAEYDRMHAADPTLEAVADIGREIDDLDRECTALVKAALETAGYRQHKRGEWRRHRETKKTATAT